MIPDFAPDTAFDLLRPAEQRVPFLFNSPHSGADYPERFLAQSRLDRRQIRKSEDAFVDRLYDFVVAQGAPLLRARFPRAYVDVNRQWNELDPAMFAGPLAMAANSLSPRVVGGLGLIPRIVGEGVSIYPGRLDPAEAEMRIASCYHPYHAALSGLIDETCARFGFAVLIDCHSMPGAITHPESGDAPDMIIGDRFGQSASPVLTGSIIALLRARGYAVSLNRPYAGGFITEHYGRPAENVHAVQIEISRRLYMDEARFELHRGYGRLRADLASVMGDLMSLPERHFTTMPLAAE